MKRKSHSSKTPQALWEEHASQWRSPSQIVAHWLDGNAIDPRLLQQTVRGRFWETLAEQNVTLLITREYEHLVMALSPGKNGRGDVSYLPVPHPSGLAVDRKNSVVHLASTRNPNQIYDLVPVHGAVERDDMPAAKRHPLGNVLAPIRTRFYAGCMYLHDLALVGGKLHANAVAHNAVVRLDEDGSWKRAWWPKCIEKKGVPQFAPNYLQLNSIAAGKDLASSFFSASSDRMSNRRPGHLNFPVDRRGVIFSGRTREPIVRGLTRPHSARMHNGKVWVANSGYGELGFCENETYVPAAKMPGWTRGLCFSDGVAFVGTSRIVPRYTQYAPGLDADRAICGVHAVDCRTGKILGSLQWPWGNQIFAIDWLPRSVSRGFPLMAHRPIDPKWLARYFYNFDPYSTETA